MSDPTERSVEVRVYERDDPRIERILDLTEEAARARPLAEVLGVLCAETAAIVEAQVASVYVRDEDDDEVLVMRANVGFPGEAIDHVRLRVGEGITGFAAECMRPVTVIMATEDAHFKAVPGLGEEAFPVFLALPILVGRRAEAVVVLQRRGGRVFEDSEVVLATALCASFAYALERARAGAQRAEDEASRKAHLTGRGFGGGPALGRVETAPSFDGLAAVARARGLAEPLPPAAAVLRLSSALEQVAKELARVFGQLATALGPEVADPIRSLLLLAEDQRLRQLLEEQCATEPNPATVLRNVVRIYARAPYDVGADRSSTERSVELEALCRAVAARIVDLRVPSQGSVVLLTDRLPAIAALLAVSQRASALVASGRIAHSSLGLAVARAGGLPLVTEVAGLFAWAREGGRVLVDGDQGIVRVNPSAATIAHFRRSSP